MYKLISLVRELRQNGSFKVSTRLFLVLLLVLGLWVATMPLSGMSLPEINDKLVHMVVFFGLALLVDLTTARKPYWFWKGFPLLCYGVLIEVLQSFTAYRLFELADIAANASGIIVYFTIKFWLCLIATNSIKT